MKKADARADEMRDNYERSDFPKGLVRGKYKVMGRSVLLDADVAAVFRTSEAVNRALRSLIQAGKAKED
jgi:hypothetical protein